jgi:hypothetical protein
MRKMTLVSVWAVYRALLRKGKKSTYRAGQGMVTRINGREYTFRTLADVKRLIPRNPRTR